MRWRGHGLTGYYVALLILLYLPIGILFLFAFSQGTSLSFPIRGFTLQWFERMFATEALMRSLRNSILVAAASSFVATALGTGAALSLIRFRFQGKALFVTLALLPLLVPFVVLGVSLLILFAAVGIPRSLLTIGAAHVVVSLPYTMLIVAARLVGFDPNLEEAAMSLGANYWQTLRRVVLPLIGSSVLAAALTAFTVSFDEFAIANFLAGREPTLPIYLFSQLRFTARLPLVVAMAALVMAGSLISLSIIMWLQWRKPVRRVGPGPRARALAPEPAS